MNKLNFNDTLLNAKGVTTGQSLADLLSDLLMSSTEKGVLGKGYFKWGLELCKTGVLELDDTSKESLSKFIEEHPNLTVLGRNRLLEAFNPLVKADGGGDPLPPDPTHPHP